MMTPKPASPIAAGIRASVIIPTYGRSFEEMCPALESLFAQLPEDCEIIIVDQNKEEDAELARFVARDERRIKHVRISEKGLPNARNVGATRARGEILIFCDDDVFALRGLIDAHLACYQDASVGGVAGRVISGMYLDSPLYSASGISSRPAFQNSHSLRERGKGIGLKTPTKYLNSHGNAGAAPLSVPDKSASSSQSGDAGRTTALRSRSLASPSEKKGELAFLSTPRQGARTDVGRFRWWDADFRANFDAVSRCEVDSAFGCNMSFRRALVLKVGGFSKLFGGTAHLEESDLCLRLRKAGFKLIFEPAACLVHLKGIKGGCRTASTRRWVYWYCHNYLLLFLRHFRAVFLPLFLLERLARLVRFGVESGDPLVVLEGIKGLVDGAHTYIDSKCSGHLGSLDIRQTNFGVSE